MAEAVSVLPCPKCGSAGDVRKAGSNRHWVQCARYGGNGNCNVISSQAENKKDAIAAWNKLAAKR